MIYLGPSTDIPIDQGDIVDQCPLTFLTEYDLDLPGKGHRRARLLSPYREHLAKHFADTFSRIGLPEPYESKP